MGKTDVNISLAGDRAVFGGGAGDGGGGDEATTVCALTLSLVNASQKALCVIKLSLLQKPKTESASKPNAESTTNTQN